jgi:parvulin-like peptidyl-prolyl isomerase
MIMGIAVAVVLGGCARNIPAAAEAGDTMLIVARINGADITLHALNGMMKRMEEINARTATTESREEIRKKALDNLILQELALQEAERRGLHVEEEIVDRAMQRFIASKGHEEGYQDYLEKQKISAADVRAQFERSLLLQRITGMEVLSKVTVTDDDVRKEYENHKDHYRAPEKITAVDVAVSLRPGDEAAMKKANELLAQVNADKDKDPQRLVRDDLFTVRQLDLDKGKEPELYAAARQLKEGELSGVIRTGDGIHIVKLTGYAPERQLSYEEAKGTIFGKLKAIAQVKRFEEWGQELKKDATIELFDPPVRREQKKP